MILKLAHLISKDSLGKTLLVVLTILCISYNEPANAASEPGTVTIVLGSEPPNLEPGSSPTTLVGQVLTKNITESLTDINTDDYSVIPKLATSWKQINATTWQFFLRKGVKFHDGQDFNAEAVIFNIKRLYDKRRTSEVRAKFFATNTMEGKALNSHTLEIKLEKPEPLLPALMAVLALCSPNTPQDDKLSRNPIGTGPYRFVKWDAGTQIILERFDGYWGKRPQVQKAIYIWRAESSVRAAMVNIGEADLTPNIARQDANRPDLDHSYLDSETNVFHIQAEEPPLNDRRVRMALNYAVDRDAIRGSILSKDMIPATQLVVPNIPGHNPDLKVWPYDPQKAKQLLDEARKDGVPLEKEISIVVGMGSYPGQDEVAEAVATMYRTVGLKVKVQTLEAGRWRPYLVKPFPKVGPYILASKHDNNKGDPAFTVVAKYHCTGIQSHTCDKKLDDLIDKARVTATGDERKKLWQAAFKRIHEEIIPDVILFHMVSYTRIGKRINFKPTIAMTSEIQLVRMTFR